MREGVGRGKESRSNVEGVVSEVRLPILSVYHNG